MLKSEGSFFSQLIISALLILVLIISIFNNAWALLPCNCLEDRVLILKNPPMKGGDVLLLQQRLRDLDYYTGTLDVIYDVEVARAVADFQADKSLEPDGVVEAVTWKALGEGLNFDNTVIVSTKPNGKLSIVINTYNRTLTLYANRKKYKTYPVAIGKPSTKSPIGEWAIIGKSKDWGGGFGTRWLGLNVPWGIYGIHGTNKPWSIGSAASQGCIRMFNKHVEELYQWVPVKTRVTIIGKRLPITVNRVLKPGQTGLSVMQLQDNLNEYGFQSGYRDARYGITTETAVSELEAQFDLKIDGIADWNVLYLLNLPGGD